MTRAIAAIAAKVALGATLVFTPHTHVANAAPLEDSPAWSCVDDGNRICGPGNANGAPAGCYDVGGVLVAAWPCTVVVNPDGSSDVFTPDERH